MTGIAGNIAGGARDTRRLKSVGGDTEKIQIFKITKEDLEVQEHSTIIETKNYRQVMLVYMVTNSLVYMELQDMVLVTDTALIMGFK